MASLNGLLGSVDAVKHIFEGAQSAPLHPQRRLTITGQDGSETLVVLPVPPHHFFSYRRPGGDARGYQLVICGHLVSPEARVWLRQGIGDLHGREWEQQEEGGEEEAATEDEAATTLGREDEAEALINLAANLVSELQSHEYLFTTDVKNIAALVFVATFLSKMVPVTASFKSKEALQQALWRVVLAPWKAPPSSHVGHVMAAPPPLGSCPDSRPYLVSRQYISERRRNVLAVMVGLFQLPEGPRQEARDALCGLARGALGQAVAEGAILLQGDAGLEGVAIRINDDYTKVPLCPISSWRSLPPHEWKFHIRCDIFFLGLKHMVHQRRIFPNKDKNTEGARPVSAVLQKILDGLRMGMENSGSSRDLIEAHKLMQALRNLGQRQQDLLDETFQKLRALRAQQDRSEPGESPQGLNGGAAEQETLRRELGEQMLRLDSFIGGIPPSVGKAERAMRGAVDALGAGHLGTAVENQTEAVEHLNQALESAGEAMARKLGGLAGMFADDPDEDGGGGGDFFGRSPEGGYRGLGVDQVKIPDRSELHRAQEILRELRRRAGERYRAPTELDYIERLLHRF